MDVSQVHELLDGDRRQKTEDRRQKTEDRRQKTEDRRQKSEVRRQKSEDRPRTHSVGGVSKILLGGAGRGTEFGTIGFFLEMSAGDELPREILRIVDDGRDNQVRNPIGF